MDDEQAQEREPEGELAEGAVTREDALDDRVAEGAELPAADDDGGDEDEDDDEGEGGA